MISLIEILYIMKKNCSEQEYTGTYPTIPHQNLFSLHCKEKLLLTKTRPHSPPFTGMPGRQLASAGMRVRGCEGKLAVPCIPPGSPTGGPILREKEDKKRLDPG